MPWKNGGGVTRELLKLPHPSDPARFLARLSIATVAASGPFSVFPGVDRIIMLLEGQGMALSIARAPEVVLDQRWQPFAFPGDAESDCRLLGGAVRDFNLMVDRATAEATLAVVHLGPGETRTVAGASTVLLHVLEGRDAAGRGGDALGGRPRGARAARGGGGRRGRHPPEPPGGIESRASCRPALRSSTSTTTP